MSSCHAKTASPFTCGGCDYTTTEAKEGMVHAASANHELTSVIDDEGTTVTISVAWDEDIVDDDCLDDEVPAACTCTNFCSDDHSLIDCAHCKSLDVYDPCPVVGFGCGEGCECCTPEQQKAAD